MSFCRSALGLSLSAALISAAAADTPVQRKLGSLHFEPCSLTAESVAGAIEAQCTTLKVPENRADPESRQIELALAWLPADAEPEADPIFMIAGGPGQSAREAYPTVAAAFADVNRSRHVLLLDARGTGGSHPLVCRNAKGEPAITEGDDESPEAAAAFAAGCRDALAKDSDLRFYSTSEHIDDIDAVRAAIGAEQINLIGVSYGTRVAQQYAKRYPQQIRSLVLDSVAPNSLVLGSEHARNLEDALNAQFERCRTAQACAQQLGDPRENLDKVAALLKGGGLPAVRFRSARSGDWQEVVPRYGHLGILLRLYAYAPQTAALLPLILSEAAQGRFEPMLAQADIVEGNITGAIYHGMQLSVMCAEDAADLVVNPADAATVMGAEFAAFVQAQCAVWPKGERPADFRAPLSGELPVLVLSGEFDPVTPPRYGDEVVKSLPQGRHLVLAGQGHSVVGVGCMPKLFAQFVEKADAKALDTKCLKRLQATPPFAGGYGWEP